MKVRKVTVCLEHRFYRVGDHVYTALSFPYSYWQDYLTYFDEITVVARVKEVDKVEGNYVLASGDFVEFLDFPYYVGFREFVGRFFVLFFSAFRVAKSGEKFLLRSGNVSNLVWIFVMMLGKDYLREFPGNIKEGVIGVTGGGLFYSLIAVFLDGLSKVQARFSGANSFVSQYCKEIYQSGSQNYVFSSFRASEINFHKVDFSPSSPFVISCVGRLEGEKGHASLMEAMSYLLHRGIATRLVLIGDGSRRSGLEVMATDLGLDVEFMGSVTDRDCIFRTVRDSDLFVLPSLTEGMPRALLEAMTIGTPCIATNVGGIPEVMPSFCLVDSGSPVSLASKMADFLDSEEVRKNISDRNRNFIDEKFSDEKLNKEKSIFWSRLYE